MSRYVNFFNLEITTLLCFSSLPILIVDKVVFNGEEIDAPEDAKGGWCVITYKGSSLGGGKISGGKIKNHYPKGLRNRKI